jgi:Tfp pilus assembly protein PilF
MSDSQSAHRKSRQRLVVAGAAVAVLLPMVLAGVWWAGRDPAATSGVAPAGAAPDPRLTLATPFLNVRPSVKYVGDQACADCHVEESKHYRQHPMGRSLAPVAAAGAMERFEAASNPFGAAGLRYGIERRDDRVFHREWTADPREKVLAEHNAEVQFTVGSGANARSYLVNHDGFLFESPITWYVRGERWDLSPSYEARNRHFSRPIAPGCLFCHCNYAEHVPDTVNRFREPIFQGFAIGCERCHGPGELHVQRRGQGEAADEDNTIVNPARLDHASRDAICQQCHLQGEQRVLARGRGDYDFRPGLPLQQFAMTFVHAGDQQTEFAFVSSVEQLVVSRCYKKSEEPHKLGCTSCHDPHRQPAAREKVTHYRDRCLLCHTPASCSVPAATRLQTHKDDSCIACHMPQTGGEVNHVAITDHRIPRRSLGRPAMRQTLRTTPAPSELIPFPGQVVGVSAEDISRNRGVALMAMLDRSLPEEVAGVFAAEALPLLERACRRDPKDAPAREARADALRSVARREEALAAYEALLAERPEAEQTLHRAGDLALAMNRLNEARSYLERAARVNPWRWTFHHGLAVAAFRSGEWAAAVGAAQEALRLEPASAATRSLLIQCYLATGDGEKADVQFATLLHSTPDERRPGLHRWFETERRRLSQPRSGGR